MKHDKERQIASMYRQQYTPKLVTGTCANCRHLKFDLELPAWMRRSPKEWGHDDKQQVRFRCGYAGSYEFPVLKLGSCGEHSFNDDPKL